MRRTRRADALAVALLVALAAGYLGSALANGVALVPVAMLQLAEPWKSETAGVAELAAPNNEISDTIWEVVPLARAAVELWRQGEPLWNPYLMLGAPALATGKLFAHPVFLSLATMLDPVEALDWTAFLHLALAGVGAFLLLRELGCRTLAALVGALALELNTHLLEWLSFPYVAGSIAWLPWVFLGLERAVHRERPAWSLLGAGAFAAQILSGYVLIPFLSAIAGAARIAGLVLTPPRGGRRVARLLLAGALTFGGGAGLAAFQLLPSAELFLHTVRTETRDPDPFLSVGAALQLLTPRGGGQATRGPIPESAADFRSYGETFYFGLLPLALLAAACAGRGGPRGALAYPLLGVVPLLAAFGAPGARQLVGTLAPVVELARYPRLLAWLVFPIAIAAGLGAERLLRERREAPETRLPRRVAVASLALFALVAIGFYGHSRGARGAWIQHDSDLLAAAGWAIGGALLLALLPRLRAARTLAWLVPFAVALDLSLAIRGWNSRGDSRFVLPETASLERLASAVAAVPAGEAPRVLSLHSNWTLPGRTAEAFGLTTPAGYTSWMLKRVSRLGDASGERARAQPNHLYFESCCGPILDSAGVRFVLAGSETARRIDSFDFGRLMRLAQRAGSTQAGPVPRLRADGVTERWMYQPAPGRLELPLGESRPLVFAGGIAIDEKALTCPTDGVEFSVVAILGDGRAVDLYRRFLDPASVPADRGVQPVRADLGGAGGVVRRLVLATDPGPRGSNTCDWSHWVDPRFEPPPGEPPALVALTTGANTIFENREALPRAWIVHRLGIAAPNDLDRVASWLIRPRYRPATEAVIESAALPPLGEPTGPELARVTRIRPHSLELEVAASAPGLLVVSDAFYPGWRAEVDGVEREIVPTDLAFRGVAIAPGERRVRFRFAPASFRIGLGISVVTSASILAALAFGFRRRRRRVVA